MVISSTTKKDEVCVNSRKSASRRLWNLLEARSKHVSGNDMERRTTGRTRHEQINEETGWPAPSVSSTQRRSESKPTQDTDIQLKDKTLTP